MRWIVLVFGGAALALVPWIVLLLHALPSTHRAAHWDLAWAGFDVGLDTTTPAGELVACWNEVRRRQRVEGIAGLLVG